MTSKKVAVELDAPEKLAAGEHLKATARLTVPEEDQGKLCTGAWYLNGELMSEEPLILGKGGCDLRLCAELYS